MNPWEMFCQLCKTVVEEQNVYLNILFTGNGIEFMFMPMEGNDETD